MVTPLDVHDATRINADEVGVVKTLDGPSSSPLSCSREIRPLRFVEELEAGEVEL